MTITTMVVSDNLFVTLISSTVKGPETSTVYSIMKRSDGHDGSACVARRTRSTTWLSIWALLKLKRQYCNKTGKPHKTGQKNPNSKWTGNEWELNWQWMGMGAVCLWEFFRILCIHVRVHVHSCVVHMCTCRYSHLVPGLRVLVLVVTAVPQAMGVVWWGCWWQRFRGWTSWKVMELWLWRGQRSTLQQCTSLASVSVWSCTV